MRCKPGREVGGHGSNQACTASVYFRLISAQVRKTDINYQEEGISEYPFVMRFESTLHQARCSKIKWLDETENPGSAVSIPAFDIRAQLTSSGINKGQDREV